MRSPAPWYLTTAVALVYLAGAPLLLAATRSPLVVVISAVAAVAVAADARSRQDPWRWWAVSVLVWGPFAYVGYVLARPDLVRPAAERPVVAPVVAWTGVGAAVLVGLGTVLPRLHPPSGLTVPDNALIYQLLGLFVVGLAATAMTGAALATMQQRAWMWLTVMTGAVIAACAVWVGTGDRLELLLFDVSGFTGDLRRVTGTPGFGTTLMGVAGLALAGIGIFGALTDPGLRTATDAWPPSPDPDAHPDPPAPPPLWAGAPESYADDPR